MEPHLHLLLFLPLLLIFFFLEKLRATKKPTVPRGLPFIGNLHQLDNSLLYGQLWKLSKTYGPHFSLLSSRQVLVVSSAKMAEQFLKNHDLEVSSRPFMLGQQRLSYNGLDIAFSPYGEYWREIRKIIVVHLFSLKRVLRFSFVREFEVLQTINKISVHAASSKVKNLSEILMSLTSTIICRIAFGKRYEEEGIEKSRFHEMLNESQALMATFFVCDYIPLMGWIDKFTGLLGRLERNFEEFDQFYQQVINEHLDPNRQSDEEDLVDVLLQLKKQCSFSFDLTYDHIKAVILVIKAVILIILLGGTDSSAATSIWAMVGLLKNPRVMNKAQEEVRNLCGKKGFLI